MDRRIRIGLMASAALVIAYPLAAWAIGFAIQHEWQQREELLLERVPYLELVKRDYHRGVYSATEETVYRLRGPVAQYLNALGGDADLTRLQATVRNTIHHGPLPQIRAFAPATVDSEVLLPPALHARLAQLLGNKATLAIHTRLNWLGGSTTEVNSRAFEQSGSDGTTLSWRGLEGVTDVGADLRRWRTDFSAPGLSVKSAAGSLEVEDLRVHSERRAVFEEVYVGPLNLTLGRIEITQTTPARQLSIRNVTFDTRSSAQGDYVDMDAKVAADNLQVAGFAASRLGYEMHAAHLHGPSLSALIRSVEAAQARSTDGTASTEQVQQALMRDGEEILLHDPVFELPRIELAMPEGELLISLKVHLQGLTREELDGPPAMLRITLARHMQASADLRIDTALLDKLLDSTGKGDRLASPLQGLQQQGYLKLDGKALTTHLTYRGGRLEVNGLSFPAIGPMPPPVRP